MSKRPERGMTEASLSLFEGHALDSDRLSEKFAAQGGEGLCQVRRVKFYSGGLAEHCFDLRVFLEVAAEFFGDDLCF